MSQPASSTRPDVNLHNRNLAALYAWLVPGAGHLYQGRYAKGVLFMVCILSTWIFGLVIGSSRVVYAAWQPNDYRWQYIFQVGVGVPAFPALAQAYASNGGEDPLFGVDFMIPPGKVLPDSGSDELAQWHAELGHMYEMGTLYTMIAGLLNILAIYDAYAGPLYTEELRDEKKRKKKTTKTSSPSDRTVSIVGWAAGGIAAMMGGYFYTTILRPSIFGDAPASTGGQITLAIGTALICGAAAFYGVQFAASHIVGKSPAENESQKSDSN